MSCPTCDFQGMRRIATVNKADVLWCPVCGTIVRANVSEKEATVEQPRIVPTVQAYDQMMRTPLANNERARARAIKDIRNCIYRKRKVITPENN